MSALKTDCENQGELIEQPVGPFMTVYTAHYRYMSVLEFSNEKFVFVRNMWIESLQMRTEIAGPRYVPFADDRYSS